MSESLRLRSLLAMGVSAAAILGVAAPALAQDDTGGPTRGAIYVLSWALAGAPFGGMLAPGSRVPRVQGPAGPATSGDR